MKFHLQLFSPTFSGCIHAARAGIRLRGKPATSLWLRIPMQALFIAVAFWSAR